MNIFPDWYELTTTIINPNGDIKQICVGLSPGHCSYGYYEKNERIMKKNK